MTTEKKNREENSLLDKSDKSSISFKLQYPLSDWQRVKETKGALVSPGSVTGQRPIHKSTVYIP